MTVAAIITIVGLALISLVIWSKSGSKAVNPLSPHGNVGVVEIEGEVSDSKKKTEEIRDFAKDDSYDSIVIRINSPGGPVGPSQEIHRAVEKASENKMVIASMGNTAASGGYYIASAADKIFANAGTITGSIGVVSQIPNFKEITDTLGFEMNTITSGDQKAAGSPFSEFNEEDEEYFQSIVDDTHKQFVSDIAKNRPIDKEKVEELATGGVYTGRQAMEKGLVDEIGSFYDSIDWIADEKDMDEEPKLHYPMKPKEPISSKLIDKLIKGCVSEIKSEIKPKIEAK